MEENKAEKRLITKSLLKKYKFKYLEEHKFWYREFTFSDAYKTLIFRYRYDERIMETQIGYCIWAEPVEYHSEEEGYKLLKTYHLELIWEL